MRLFILAMTAIFNSKAMAVPSEIIIIRHAEKPASGNELSPRGFERANALPQFFSKFEAPVAIFAMGVKQDMPEESVRAIQTVIPLARTLGLKINTAFTKNETQGLIQTIMNTSQYDGHLVVICWEHKVIPMIAAQLGVPNPPPWSGETFDRAWILNFSENHFSNFSNVGQHLLPGDSPN